MLSLFKLAKAHFYRNTLSYSRQPELTLARNTHPGAVIASPTITSETDYAFNWTRDAALIMHYLVDTLGQEGIAANPILFQKIKDYIAFVEKTQNVGKEYYAAAKFHIDGTPYTGKWGNPQTDGPALRAITLIDFYHVIQRQQPESPLLETLYTPNIEPTTSIIKRDLEHIAHSWHKYCFDLWEEYKAQHFYTLFVIQKALKKGATLAQALGDCDASDFYLSQVTAINQYLQSFWLESSQVLTVSHPDTLPKHWEKSSGLDIALILALLHGQADSHDVYQWDSPEVLCTVNKIVASFDGKYPIQASCEKGILMGRYPEDTFTGHHEERGEGSPWILATCALGEFYIHLYRTLQQQDHIVISELTLDFYARLLIDHCSLKEQMLHNLKPGKQTGLLRLAILEAVQTAATNQMHCIAPFIGNQKIREQVGEHGLPTDLSGVLPEQVHREDGEPTGAKSLTWSALSLLTFFESARAAELELTPEGRRHSVGATTTSSLTPDPFQQTALHRRSSLR